MNVRANYACIYDIKIKTIRSLLEENMIAFKV